MSTPPELVKGESLAYLEAAAKLTDADKRAYFGVVPSAPIQVVHRTIETDVTDRHAARYIALDEVMALEPSAVGRAFYSFFDDDDDDDDREYEVELGVATICIDGPLMQRGGWWWDGYDSILERFESALEDEEVQAVILKISSPGGVCAGCFSTVRSMLASKAQAGKPVYAFADESAYSAGYAIACVADQIFLPREGGVGSIGVICTLEDWSGFNQKQGIKVAVITSGARKADGHPDLPLTQDVIDRAQARINMLAQSFAEIVATARGMTSEGVLALEAGCFYGAEAVAKGLANGVKSFEDVVALATQSAALRGVRVSNAPMGAHRKALQMSTKNESAAGELITSYAEFALAVGLDHEASKGDVLAAIAKARASSTALVAAIASDAKSGDEAIGKLAAERTGVEQLLGAIGAKTVGEAITNVGTERKERETAKAKTLIDGAIAAGKLQSNGEKAFAHYEKHGMASLESFLDALVPQPALTAPAMKQLEPPANAAKPTDPAVKVVLTPEDEKLITKHGLDRAKFISAREQELKDRAFAQS